MEHPTCIAGIELFPNITVWHAQSLGSLSAEDAKTMRAAIDLAGRLSQKAQGLGAPITDFARLSTIRDQKLYMAACRTQSGGMTVIGILKTGLKNLFIRRADGQLRKIRPVCVLDFYVHESYQRGGWGRQLFGFFLEAERVKPQELAYDRPSPKLLAFLRKHFGLEDYVPQSNNFVVFEAYFGDRQEQPQPDRRASGQRRASGAGLDAPPPAPPVPPAADRVGGRRRTDDGPGRAAPGGPGSGSLWFAMGEAPPPPPPPLQPRPPPGAPRPRSQSQPRRAPAQFEARQQQLQLIQEHSARESEARDRRESEVRRHSRSSLHGGGGGAQQRDGGEGRRVVFHPEHPEHPAAGEGDDELSALSAAIEEQHRQERRRRYSAARTETINRLVEMQRLERLARQELETEFERQQREQREREALAWELLQLEEREEREERERARRAAAALAAATGRRPLPYDEAVAVGAAPGAKYTMNTITGQVMAPPGAAPAGAGGSAGSGRRPQGVAPAAPAAPSAPLPPAWGEQQAVDDARAALRDARRQMYAEMGLAPPAPAGAGQGGGARGARGGIHQQLAQQQADAAAAAGDEPRGGGEIRGARVPPERKFSAPLRPTRFVEAADGAAAEGGGSGGGGAPWEGGRPGPSPSPPPGVQPQPPPQQQRGRGRAPAYPPGADPEPADAGYYQRLPPQPPAQQQHGEPSGAQHQRRSSSDDRGAGAGATAHQAQQLPRRNSGLRAPWGSDNDDVRHVAAPPPAPPPWALDDPPQRAPARGAAGGYPPTAVAPSGPWRAQGA